MTLAASSLRRMTLSPLRPPIDDVVLPHAKVLARRQQALVGGRCILLAGDDATTRQAMSRQLALLGWTCTVTTGGAQALQAWQQRPRAYWMVLVDLKLPPLNGFDLARMIRGHSSAGARVPILSYAAMPSSGFAAQCLRAGIDECLPDPVRLPVLSEALARWLPRGRIEPLPRCA